MKSEWTKERMEYIRGLSLDYGVPLDTVMMMADMLGPNEDHDGLVCELEDYGPYVDDEEYVSYMSELYLGLR